MKNLEQGLLPTAHSDLIMYWTAIRVRNGAVGVQRGALDFGQIRRFLSQIVLVEIGVNRTLSVRLCGSRHCQELGFDPSGMALDDLPGTWVDSIRVGIARAIETNEPACGVLARSGSDHGLAFLRLPLLDGSKALKFVLCHNEALSQEISLANPDVIHGDIHGREVAIAA